MTYIISTDKGFKLLKELPEAEYCFTFSKSYPCDGNNEHSINGYCTCFEQFEIRQQAIDSAPFIKYERTEIFKCVLKKDHPYPFDLSGYDVSEPIWEDFENYDGRDIDALLKSRLVVTL